MFLGIRVGTVRTRKVYTIDAKLGKGALTRLKKELFVDPVTEEATYDYSGKFDWLVEVRFKAGVTDAVGVSAREAIQDVLKRKLKRERKFLHQPSTSFLE
jgi:phosphoribosylformylglycinamidine (FGAM) synthase PurS component